MTQFTRESRTPVGVEPDRQGIGRLSGMESAPVRALAGKAEHRRAADLQRIDAALARMDEGKYGYCVACGDEIGVRRLDLDPAVLTCVDCACGEG